MSILRPVAEDLSTNSDISHLSDGIFIAGKLKQKWTSVRVEPAQQPGHIVLRHGGTAGSSVTVLIPDMQKDRRPGSRDSRVHVVPDDDPEAVSVIRPAHLFEGLIEAKTGKKKRINTVTTMEHQLELQTAKPDSDMPANIDYVDPLKADSTRGKSSPPDSAEKFLPPLVTHSTEDKTGGPAEKHERDSNQPETRDSVDILMNKLGISMDQKTDP
jgi:hypothetical protein